MMCSKWWFGAALGTVLGTVVAVALAPTAHAGGYATDQRGNIYRVLPETKKFERLGTVQIAPKEGQKGTAYTPILTDLALSEVHGLYGITYSDLIQIDVRDPARSRRVGALGAGASFNALVFDPDGKELYALAGDTFFQVNLKTGVAKAIGPVGSGGYSDGDLGFLADVLYGTFSRGDGSHLVKIDLKTGKGVDVGLIRLVPATKKADASQPAPKESERPAPKGKPVSAVWGLIWDGYTAWALTQGGSVLELDPKSARATLRFQTPLMFYGACPMLRL